MEEQVYYDTLDETEKLVFNIAKDHLGTSFHVTKSNGYVIHNSVHVEPIMVKKKIRVKKVIKVNPSSV
jgi:hypothetical protein